jgi:hypothetical protein
MATLSDHVSVAISLAAFTPSRQSFSIPLIAGYHTRFPELTRTYSSLQELADDGFTSEDAEYNTAAVIFAQSPTVAQIKVGRLAGAQVARVVTMLPTAVNSTVYEVIINGVSYSFTSDASATAAEISGGLVSAINAGTQAVTASLSTNNLVLTADVAGPDFFVDVGNVALWASIQDTTGARSSLDADLTAIATADENFYALLLTRNNAADLNVAAAWVASRKRILLLNAINYGAIVSAEDNLAANSTNLLADLNAALNTRAFPIFTYHDADNPAAAVVGALLWKTPGTYTAKFKQLLGVQAETLTSTERTNIETRKGNHYQTVAGVPILSQGTMSAGGAYYLDTVIFMDWLEARIKEEVFTAFTFNDKIPFTDAGIAIIASCVRKILGLAESNSAINSGWTVTVPNAASISATDKSNRFLDNVKFDCVYSGAIHSVAISGRVSP